MFSLRISKPLQHINPVKELSQKKIKIKIEKQDMKSNSSKDI